MKKYLLKTIFFMSGLCIITVFTAIFSGVLFAGNSFGQNIREVKVSLEFKQASLKQVFAKIEATTKFRFQVNPKVDEITDKVTLKAEKQRLAFVLEQIAGQTGLAFRQLDAATIVVHMPPSRGRPPQEVAAPVPERIIRGKVTDGDGEALPGASILVKGTSVGAVTDRDGKYTILVPDDATTLVVSFVGYIQEEVDIVGRSVINVAMATDITSLEEVVVSTGYWKTSKRLNTGNVAKVDAETIEQQPVTNPLQAIQGRVAGVQIQQTSGIPGSAININIRGLNSLNNGQSLEGLDLPNSNLPFYIIDGVPFPNTSLNSNRLDLPDGNPLASIRPSDIESIEVLKDADATAIYGSRGANGVILITTKKAQAGDIKFNIDISRGLGEVTNKVDLLNTEQYLELRHEAILNDGPPTNAADTFALRDVFVWDQNRFTDWQEELLGGTATQTNASISASGGTKQTQFLIRGNFFRQTNVFNFDNSAFESGSGHFNLNQTSRDRRFNANLSTTYTISNNNQNAAGVTVAALDLPPNAPALFDENGMLNWQDGFENPLGFLEREFGNKTRNLVSNLNVQYEILPGLSLKSTLGYTNVITDEFKIFPLRSFDPAGDIEDASSLTSEGIQETWIIEPQLQYSRELGPGRLNILVGTTFQESINEGFGILGFGYESDLLIRNIEAAPNLVVRDNIFSEYRYAALYGRLNYVWNDKYVLNVTGRRDGSTRFGPDKRFGNFGAVGLSWVFSEESFVSDNLPFLSFGKLRGSYGLTGNDGIGDYQFLETYLLSPTSNTYNGSTALILSRAANPDFSWETTRKLELGLELGLFQGRITLSTSWFRNRSSNQLIGQPLSTVTGFATTQFNLPALVENRGVEIELSTINLNIGKFHWTTSLNFTRYRNELVEFPNIEAFAPFNNRYVIGESTIGGKQFQTLGVNTLTGEYGFVDFNGDGIIGVEDRQDFVEIIQDYYGGVNNIFRWKDFQLNVFFYFVKQNGTDFALQGNPGNFENISVNALTRWQNPGDVTSVRRTSANNFNRGIGQTNAILTDASFLRLQNVSLSWNLPGEWLDQIKLDQARVYINGQNLWAWTDFEGLDPETGNSNLPPLRIITTGIQLTF